MSLEQSILEHAAALKDLAAAIREAAGGAAAAPVKSAPAAKPDAKAKEKDDDNDAAEDPIYWVNNKVGTFGVVDSEAAYTALKKKDKDLTKTTKTVYDKKVAAKAEADAEAAKGGGDGGDDIPTISKQDLAKAFQAFLPADLADKEKAKRRAFVKEIIDRFGGTGKVTELDEEHWALAANLVQRKMAGQDVDVESDEYQAVEATDEDDMV